MKTIQFFAAAVLTAITFSACSSDDDGPELINEEEVITTMTVTLTPTGTSTGVVTLTSRDEDGDGPNAPEITVSGPLAVNTTYDGAVIFLNETETPEENITLEVEEEGEEHQVFYQFANALGLQFSYTDEDNSGNPIGLEFTLTTTDAAQGNFTVTLRHEPDKAATGVAAGDITNAGGETDFTATFSVTVE
ncbi:type 1 periplasmic binding fold superfamily protein [Croceiramulus getboli]|nr:type 1 periplasmic binding fold superfamily protein [Flavobacteriaceae bacterium YJPT1-3]